MKTLFVRLAFALAIGLAIPVTGTSVTAYAAEQCIVCGMDVSRYPHSRYAVETKDGKKFTTCGAQCGLTLHLRLKEKWDSAEATDLLSNRTVDATKSFYVFKSSVITDMAPGFISFNRKKNAEKFATGFGGQVLNYLQALDLWKKHMK